MHKGTQQSPTGRPIRKIRSVDFGRISARSSLHLHPSSGESASNLASAFSRQASRGAYALSSGFTKNSSYGDLPGEESDKLGCSERSQWSATDVLAQPWTSEPSPSSVVGNDAASYFMRIPVAKLSVILLLLVTLTDVCIGQMHRIQSPELYDTFSTEVIRPPFSYTHSNPKPRLGLGSAAISTVTETLSPILPFTGGMDLRRSDYWTKGGTWYETLSNVASQIREAFAAAETVSVVPRGGGNVPEPLAKRSSKRDSRPPQPLIISAQVPFVSTEAIAELTLGDVAATFRYAVESSKEGFNEARFMNNQVPRVRKVLSAVHEAVLKSRGRDVKDSFLPKTSERHGDVDALKFSAAMRIFAEWRVLRQVPDGYKGFAVGMSLGQKDIVQNVAKIEQTVHSWLDHQRDLRELQVQWEKEALPGESCPIDGSSIADLRSPTLRQLLLHEVDVGVHPGLPRLKEKSTAMGLLWVRRQLHYQTALFANLLKVPSRFQSTKDAVSAAYLEVYDRYHGWAVQKIFNYSFQAAPEATEIYKFMNPSRLQLAMSKAAELRNPDYPQMLVSSRDESPIDGLIKHVTGEWDKLMRSIGVGSPPQPFQIRGGDGVNDLDHTFITEEMTKDAHEHISLYLDVAQPLLTDLAGVFDDLNMDDPTRV